MPSLGEACRAVLLTPDPRAKLMAARRLAREWRLGRLDHRFDVAMPDRPARPDQPELLPPNRMPKRKKGGSDKGRVALLHALAHIEFSAIDLAVDLVGRFGDQFPRAFADEWLKVAAEEALHFAIVDRRLRALGSFYGAMPAHDGLWEAAEETASDAVGRLAVVPLVLEARGLDVTPQMIERLEANGDTASARLLHRIYADEIGHVATGMRWFRIACEAEGFAPAPRWHVLVAKYFRGVLKPPFNDSARLRAGLTPEFYRHVAASEIGGHKDGGRERRGNSNRD